MDKLLNKVGELAGEVGRLRGTLEIILIERGITIEEAKVLARTALEDQQHKESATNPRQPRAGYTTYDGITVVTHWFDEPPKTTGDK